jgi:hypothetical protein
MYRDLYRDEVVTISAFQIVAVIAMVAFAYILPITLITQQQSNQATVYTSEALADRQDGRVAGVNTGPSVTDYWDNFVTKAPNDSKLLLAGGMFATGTGLGLLAIVSMGTKVAKPREWEMDSRF